MKMSKWMYKGPVKLFDQVISPNWVAATWAVSQSKALANLSYQYKTKNGYSPGTKIRLSIDYLFEVSALNDDYEYYDEEWRKIINESV